VAKEKSMAAAFLAACEVAHDWERKARGYFEELVRTTAENARLEREMDALREQLRTEVRLCGHPIHLDHDGIATVSVPPGSTGITAEGFLERAFELQDPCATHMIAGGGKGSLI
jgi:hypothetical protein